ncbi:MAG: hypothetical protein RI922_1477 [Bacteroidota bacterium]|jgi:hypothetical protein
MRYYVNKKAQSNGDHEVHKESCFYLPSPLNRIDLGEHQNCSTAVTEAKKHFKQSNGCKTCSKPCHTT